MGKGLVGFRVRGACKGVGELGIRPWQHGGWLGVGFWFWVGGGPLPRARRAPPPFAPPPCPPPAPSHPPESELLLAVRRMREGALARVGGMDPVSLFCRH